MEAFIIFDPGVMASGKEIIFKTELMATIEEQAKFNFGVAFNTGIGSAATGIFRAEIIQNPGLIIAAQINHIKGNAELAGNSRGLADFLLFIITETGETKMAAAGFR